MFLNYTFQHEIIISHLNRSQLSFQVCLSNLQFQYLPMTFILRSEFKILHDVVSGKMKNLFIFDLA